jgi:hypothetical protein
LAFWDGSRWVTEAAGIEPKGGRRWRDRVATASMFLVMAAALVPFTSINAADVTPRIMISPAAGPPGTSVSLTGSGFTSKTQVQLEWDDSVTGLPGGTVNGRGEIKLTLKVPAGRDGAHVVEAVVGGPTKGKGARTVQLVQVGDTLATSVFTTLSDIPPPTPVPTPVAVVTPPPTPKPVATATPTPTPTVAPTPIGAGWSMVAFDDFDAGLPSHWGVYNGAYGSYNPGSCAMPSHATVSGGALHLLMSYEPTGLCGAGWYSAGLALSGASSVDARVTVRFRVVSNGIKSHFNIPMRWPDNNASWPAGGEEDYCEGSGTTCSTYLHYGASNSQIYHERYLTGLDQWHTLQTVRRAHVVDIYLDGVRMWSYAGTATTLPDTNKHVVLQQECEPGFCPSGTTGSEDIQIDWITVEVPS